MREKGRPKNLMLWFVNSILPSDCLSQIKTKQHENKKECDVNV